MKDGFSGYHPIINFLYFTLVILCAMFLMHPLCLLFALVGSFWYSIYLNGKKAIKFNFLVLIPLLLITAILNPMFNHAGVTILTYLESGNPLTLESIVYGVAAAMMFVTVICWVSCYNAVMTTDKFVYLFGRVIPALSLLISMVLRFVPKVKSQYAVVSNAQKCIGRDVSNGSVINRLRHGVKIISVMTTWMLENAIDTADSMKSRGYGLKGRTAFSIYRFDRRDRVALAAVLCCGFVVVVSMLTGQFYFRYFPSIRGAAVSVSSGAAFAAYALMCSIPMLINLWEDRKWKSLRSSI